MSKKVTVQMLSKCQYRKTGPKKQFHEEIFESFRQILGMASEILWDSVITPTLATMANSSLMGRQTEPDSPL
jgi:hypothetical protein